jgi:hypothetical protein
MVLTGLPHFYLNDSKYDSRINSENDKNVLKIRFFETFPILPHEILLSVDILE